MPNEIHHNYCLRFLHSLALSRLFATTIIPTYTTERKLLTFRIYSQFKFTSAISIESLCISNGSSSISCLKLNFYCWLWMNTWENNIELNCVSFVCSSLKCQQLIRPKFTRITRNDRRTHMQKTSAIYHNKHDNDQKYIFIRFMRKKHIQLTAMLSYIICMAVVRVCHLMCEYFIFLFFVYVHIFRPISFSRTRTVVHGDMCEI
jgi:hypothetical protein